MIVLNDQGERVLRIVGADRIERGVDPLTSCEPLARVKTPAEPRRAPVTPRHV